MRIIAFISALWVGCALVHPVAAADDLIERLATCQTSWLDWKDDPVRTGEMVKTFHAAFLEKPEGNVWVPRGHVLVLGLPVIQGFPESVGMGVGFSVIVEASFETTRLHLEKAVAKSFKECETGEGMRTCDLRLEEKRTLTLMSGDDRQNKTTLVGCYYYYAK